MAASIAQCKPIVLPKRLSGAKALELIFIETESDNEVRNDNITEDESDEDFIPDEIKSQEIEDNVDTIANSSTDDEEHKNEEREAVGLRDY